ncbi:protoporphyrinogen oxidase HemJ [Neorickettsia sennetsu]|uniref:protoporphyrinogen oxidase HemJ n=1 Tax=Ehrlichia sennetsu TaxID=951 RepID=UPI000321B346|nr:protoporphyrinogen oxidase HemJ [Neorickettsia sennetsu]
MSIGTDWVEALHIIVVTMWMAGLFYLPRIMVYHAEVDVGTETDSVFRVMERRLLRYIMTPAMVVSIVLGLLLAIDTGHILSTWLHLKLLFVAALVSLHIFFWRCSVAFGRGCNRYSSTFFKFANEGVTIAFIAIVILAVTKPF